MKIKLSKYILPFLSLPLLEQLFHRNAFNSYQSEVMRFSSIMHNLFKKFLRYTQNEKLVLKIFITKNYDTLRLFET